MGSARSYAVLAIALAATSGCGRIGFGAAAMIVDNGSGADGSVVLNDAGLPTMTLVKKTGAPDWTPLTGPMLGLPYGVLTWEPSGPTFRMTLDVWGLSPGAAYTVVQYIDPWPGAPATDLAAATVDGSGMVSIPWSSYELNRDLTTTTGKVWLVPSAFIDTAAHTMVTWDVTAILFESDFVIYDDTDVP
jgi:hypothetical protein